MYLTSLPSYDRDGHSTNKRTYGPSDASTDKQENEIKYRELHGQRHVLVLFLGIRYP